MKKPNVFKKLPHGGKIDISEWGLIENASEYLNTKKLSELLNDGLEETLKDSPPQIWWPAIWGPEEDGIGGQPPNDPTTVYLTLPFGHSEDDIGNCYWEISLAEALEMLLEDGGRDGSFMKGALEIATGLEKLTKKIRDTYEPFKEKTNRA